ncbi:hypothetical protein GCM10027405_26490 [Arthrobacter alkaliphilus]|uniref:tyrosine-protein phosphatase n=1 Tax=Arthrobacter alkaliphilus TaxID=369936 RepID=UPI001F2A6674|nr:tyrosine-protein phosphatase [Arthrobacter alkaliphilus]
MTIHAKWEGFANVRDLGGLPTPSGRTQPGVFVRSEHPSRLTTTGWRQLHEYGIRTIVSLEMANIS